MRAFRSADPISQAGQVGMVHGAVPSTSSTLNKHDDTANRAVARLRQVLRAEGARFSTVREAIARVVVETRGHFEANDVIRELRARHVKGAHLATVYRTLPLLVKAGLIQPAMFSMGERAFYETCFERPHHDHLICTRCGVIVEFELEAIENLQRDLARCHGFELTAHFHELLGECASCRGVKDPEEHRS
jgi:Fur family transcriptional regulator, ferric uptake regulator